MPGKSELWEALTTAGLNPLEQVGVRTLFRPGEIILREHEPSTHAVLLRKGLAKVVTQSDSGIEVVLGLREGPDIVGEMAALDGQRRSASVIALTDVEAMTVTASQLNEYLVSHPLVLRALVNVLLARLREADQVRLEYVAKTVVQRLAARLVDLAEQVGTPANESKVVLEIALSQQELASWVGASREAVAKALRLLRERSVISTSRRHIVINDIDVLKTLAAD